MKGSFFGWLDDNGVLTVYLPQHQVAHSLKISRALSKRGIRHKIELITPKDSRRRDAPN